MDFSEASALKKILRPKISFIAIHLSNVRARDMGSK
jgi:hypothetical protein